ncbi:MAG: MFS transporter [Anaerolineae bacterium]
MKKPISLSQMLVLNAYWVGLSFMWNSLHPIVLPAVLLNYVPDARKNTYLGLLTFAGLLIAMIIQPLSGALSDGWSSRFGRRRPLIVIGTLFDFVFLVLLAFGGGLLWLFIGYVGLQLSSNIAHGPLQGLLPDRVPKSQVGVASSLKTFMDMLSLIIASLLAGRLLDPQTHNPTAIMLLLISLLAVSASITIFFTPEEPTHERMRMDAATLLATFKIDFRQNTAYWWLIAERALFLLGIYGVQAFAQYYLQDVLRVADPPKETGDLLAFITLGLVVLVLAGGWLTDRFRARKILYFASGISAVGMLLMLLATDLGGLKVFGGIVGAGIGLFLTSNWALANTLAPGEQAGKFLGLTNIATAGSGALARLEGPALDYLNGAWPGAWVGYKGLFIFGAACMLLSLLLLSRIRLPKHTESVVPDPSPLVG